MTPGIHNIVIVQGAYYSDEFTVSEDGVAEDFTNYLVRSQARLSKDSPDVAFTFTCGIAVPASGKIQHSLLGADSANVPAGVYQWDVETYLAGNIGLVSWLAGTVTILERTTKPV